MTLLQWQELSLVVAVVSLWVITRSNLVEAIIKKTLMDRFIFVGATAGGEDIGAVTSDDFACVLNSSTAIGSCSDGM